LLLVTDHREPRDELAFDGRLLPKERARSLECRTIPVARCSEFQELAIVLRGKTRPAGSGSCGTRAGN